MSAKKNSGFENNEERDLPEAEGLIIKATGGFYYVKSGETVYECRARGIFRKEETSPLVGDRVTVAVLPDEKGYINSIHERKNSLVRPPLANLDQLVMVISVAEPAPNLLVMDKLIAVAEWQEVEPVIVFTKTDLANPSPYSEIYRKAGFRVYEVCAPEHEGTEAVLKMLSGKISAFCGNSGAGKSSLLNDIFPGLGLSTAEISKKLGRGRHTTRHTELFELPRGGFVADTPGFSAIEMERVGVIRKDSLQYCFREFEPYLLECKFTGCSHVSEKGCAVLEAVKEGMIPESRHRNYCAMYEEAKQLKEWELDKE
ncbi:MAG: ribosome small subunit-dependent GTPase A [Oscillospiraceae bacterium]